MKKIVKIWHIALCLMVFPLTGFGQTILLRENFDDNNFASRGWYDGTGGSISKTQYIPGSAGSFECRWLKGGTNCVGGLPRRHKFTPTNSVYVSYWLKHSSTWTGKGTHLTYLLTTEDGDYAGLARARLDAYINEGTVTRFTPDLELQDALNIDEGKINVNLTSTTERRAAQGCNGLLDNSHDFVSCYSSGTGQHTNMRVWNSPEKFTTTAGPYSMTDWHRIEAYYKLNDIDGNGKGNANGVLRLWLDGKLLINHNNVHFRTGAYPNMLFNQFIIAPYMGPSEADQTIWFDDLIIATAPPTATQPSPPTKLIVN